MSNNIREFGLQQLIKECVLKALLEQEVLPQQNTGSPVPPAAPAPPQEQLQPPQPPPPVDGQEQAPAAVMTIDSMIERLNVIRGGKSFTDPEVYGQIVTYFKKITPDQNQVIDQFLKDISQIMINVRVGNTADEQPPATASQTPTTPTPTGGQQAPISPGGSAAPAPVTGGAGTQGV